MYDFQRDQLVIRVGDRADEEEGCISTVDDLGIYDGPTLIDINPSASDQPGLRVDVELWDAPLYSKKLHILVRLASTSCVTSLTILALALGGRV
jgi:hypothetical protein